MRQAGASLFVILVTGIAYAAASGWALAQDAEIVQRLERQLRTIDETYRLQIPQDQPISERLVFDVGGSARVGFLAVDNQFGTTRILRQYDGRLYARAELDGAHRAFARLKFLYDDFNSGDSFDGRGDELDEPIADQYWYQFDLRGAHQARTGQRLDYNVNVKGGRLFVNWASGMTLSNDLYGGVADFEWGPVGLIAVAGVTPSISTIDFDGSRPRFDRDTDRAFFGGLLEYRGIPTHRPYAGVLFQRDHNNDFVTFLTPIGAFPTAFDYDSEYWIVGSRGSFGPKLVYRVEFVYETGESMSNTFSTTTGAAVAQTEEDIQAWAGLASLFYLLRDDWDTRLEGDFVIGSGDDDRIDESDTFGGNESGTDDESFNSLGYVNTGLALAPTVSNLMMLRLGASTSPPINGLRKDALRVGVSGFLFGKLHDDAPISASTTDDFFVGSEADIFVDWRIRSDLSLSVRYGVFFPGDAIPPGEDDPRHFFYAGVTYAF